MTIGDTYSSVHYGGTPGQKAQAHNKLRKIQELKQAKKRTLPNKCLCQIPARFAVEMIDRGWILRNEIIWHKPNCMPMSDQKKFTPDFEKIFFFVKNQDYYFNQQFEKSKNEKDNAYRMELRKNKKYNAKRDYKNNFPTPKYIDKRNKRCVWPIPTKPFKGNHCAPYPEQLCITPILAGCPERGIVLDPFIGAGTTAVVAKKLKRNYIGIELNQEYVKTAENRISSIPFPIL